jgi:hypothetical protein
MLAHLHAQYAQYAADRTFPTTHDLSARFKGRGGEAVPATTVQTLADRLSKALKGAERRCNARGTGKTLAERPWPAGRLPPLQDAQPPAEHSIAPVRRAPGCVVAGCVAGQSWEAPAGARHAGAIAQAPATSPPGRYARHGPSGAAGGWARLCADRLRDDATGCLWRGASCAVSVRAVSVRACALGLGVGLKVFSADSDGRMVENPHH